MISIYCKASKDIRKKLGKKWRVCEFLSDGYATYHNVRYMDDLPTISYKVTRDDFEKVYVNTLLALNGYEPIYPSISLMIKEYSETVGQMGGDDNEEGEGFEKLTVVEKLRFKLESAEKNSNYELAAILRDQIKHYENGGDDGLNE